MSTFYIDDRNGNKIPAIINDATNLISGSYELTQIFLKVVSSVFMRSIMTPVSQVIIEIGKQVVATEFAIYQQQVRLKINKFETATEMYVQAWKNPALDNYPAQFKAELQRNLMASFQQEMEKIQRG